MARLGLDWAWGAMDPQAVRKAGADFAIRYLSHDPTKNISAAEAKRLSDAGIDIVLVWESTAARALGGYGAGVIDAEIARAQAKAAGLPDGRPVYFAVDFDASDKQKPVIAAYLKGAASVLGHAGTGVYGGYWVVRYMAEHDACHWFWQTYAWSGGNVFQRLGALVKRLRGQAHTAAHLLQFRNGVTVGGVSCDWDRALQADFGQWRLGVPKPKPKPPAPTPSYPTLREGDKGEAVHHLQSDLAGLRYKLQADGVFGPQTLAAVKRFQRARGLAVDGIVGPATWAAIQTALQHRGKK